MSSFPLQQPRRLATLVAVALLVAAVVSPATSQAQQLIASSSSAIPAEDSSLPDAPSHVLYPQSGQTAPPPQPIQTTNPDAVSPNGTQQTKRILGIMPNFRSVSADIKLPPQTSRQKFIAAGHDTFDYSSFFIAGIQAGFSMNGNSYPEFHQGAKGYARYYWHTLADTTTENFMVGGLGPVVFHQDNRYYTLGHGGFRKRTFYALTRVLISRKDDGDSTFNFAEVIGSGAAAGTSTLYYPTKYRTWTKVGQKWL
ncbi:MAG: hypothetical protein JWP98_1262, partial [Edaphobacter sp.]|nr:hypothetical protein [Edaphobacter sp.]